MANLFFIIIIALIIVNILVSVFKKPRVDIKPQLKTLEESMIKFDSTIDKMERLLKDEFHRNRAESNDMAKNSRDELSKSLRSFEEKFSENTRDLKELLRQNFGDFSKQQSELNRLNTENIKEVKQTVEKQLNSIRDDNTRQLDEMRKTVDEKLQKTLNDRLSQSFETVSKQLQAVQEGLGEMRNFPNSFFTAPKTCQTSLLRF